MSNYVIKIRPVLTTFPVIIENDDIDVTVDVLDVGVEYDATLMATSGPVDIQVRRDDEDTLSILSGVISPAGMCIVIDLPLTEEETCFPCCGEGVEITIVPETRFAIMGEDGCPVGDYVTFENLQKALAVSICDYFTSENEEPILASDSLVAITKDCKLRRVNKTELCCGE